MLNIDIIKHICGVYFSELEANHCVKLKILE